MVVGAEEGFMNTHCRFQDNPSQVEVERGWQPDGGTDLGARKGAQSEGKGLGEEALGKNRRKERVDGPVKDILDGLDDSPPKQESEERLFGVIAMPDAEDEAEMKLPDSAVQAQEGQHGGHMGEARAGRAVSTLKSRGLPQSIHAASAVHGDAQTHKPAEAAGLRTDFLRKRSSFTLLLHNSFRTKLFAQYGMSRKTIISLRSSLLQRHDIEVAGKIGEGACGDVYSGKVCGEDAAIKTIRSSLASASGPQEMKDLMKELRVLAEGLQHPNIVQFKGVCVDGGCVLLACELMLGGSLEDLLQGKPAKGLRGLLSKRPMSQTVKWCTDLLAAIDFLHSRSPPMVHRDLKPANLLLSEDLRTIKLTDFGLSRWVTAASDSDCSTPSMRRGSSFYESEVGTPLRASIREHAAEEDGLEALPSSPSRRKVLPLEHRKGSMTAIAGTYRYMAPEMARGEGQYTEKVDVYACGLIMWAMVEGRRPWENLSGEAALLGAKTGSRPLMGGRQWPAEMIAIVAAAWDQDAAARPGAKEVLARLNGYKPKASLLGSISARTLSASASSKHLLGPSSLSARNLMGSVRDAAAGKDATGARGGQGARATMLRAIRRIGTWRWGRHPGSPPPPVWGGRASTESETARGHDVG